MTDGPKGYVPSMEGFPAREDINWGLEIPTCVTLGGKDAQEVVDGVVKDLNKLGYWTLERNAFVVENERGDKVWQIIFDGSIPFAVVQGIKAKMGILGEIAKIIKI